MAEDTNTAPGTRPEATGKTRREAFTALGATALAGVAAIGFATSDKAAGSAPPSADTALLAACATFAAAHEAQERSNAAPGWDEAEINRIGEASYQAIEAIIDAPRPQTTAGLIALAAAARVAFTDQVNDLTAETFDEQASPEERLVMAALTSVAELRA